MNILSTSFRFAAAVTSLVLGSISYGASCEIDLAKTKIAVVSPQSDSQTPKDFQISKLIKSFEISNSAQCVALVEVKVSKSFLNDDPSLNKDLTENVPIVVMAQSNGTEPEIKVLDLINQESAMSCGNFELKMDSKKKDQPEFHLTGHAKPCAGGSGINKIDKIFKIQNGKAVIQKDHSKPVH